MRFTIPKSDFLRQLQAVAAAAARTAQLPILTHIAIEAGAGKLTITATDLCLQLTASQPLEAEFTGSTTVSAKKLLDIVKSMPAASDITFELRDGMAIVMGGRSRFKLATLPITDFPQVEEVKLQHEFSVQQGVLKQLLERTAHAMAVKDVRYYLNGVALHVTLEGLRAVATDGHRLALAHADIAGAELGPMVIIDHKAADTLRALLDAPARPAVVHLGTNHLLVELPFGDGGSLVVTTKLVDGKFPEYQRVIPDHHQYSITVPREQLLLAVRRVALLSNSNYRGITMHFSDSVLTLAGRNADQEEAFDEIDFPACGVDIMVGFNADYVIDVLNTITGDTVRIDLISAESSGVFADADNDSAATYATYVIMPMRL